ncbi:hypothetical protein [Sorangium sp. So ce1099]|uniref:hypothetical protein n=1 Tax=Sorangium sp. So ce1099 TaxID=3133331 RepID=UPI003F5E127E
MNGCISAEPAGEPERRAGESIGEEAGAITTGIYRCATGETDEGSLVIQPNGTCVEYTTTLAGASEQYCHHGVCSSCRRLSHRIQCLLISRYGEPLALAPGTRLYRCTFTGGTTDATLVIKPDETCTPYDTPLAGSSEEHCADGVCPSCWDLGRDLGCRMTP